MKAYIISSLISALVFLGVTLAIDALFYEVGVIWKYVISGLIFGFVYEGWWLLYKKGVFSRKRLSELFRKH